MTRGARGELRASCARDRDVVLIENDRAGPIAGAPRHAAPDARTSAWAVDPLDVEVPRARTCASR